MTEIVYTIGEVAKKLRVSPSQVKKWFDAGHLRGYRVPFSTHRRIPSSALAEFTAKHDIGQLKEVL